MTHQILLVAHIAVLGYWLGSELVINSEYRFICYRDDLPFAARDAMTDHLMDVDQHVRYALILQLMLGTMLAAALGYFPAIAWSIAPFAGAAWIVLVELVHRKRKTQLGQTMAMFDRGIRYCVFAGLVALAFGLVPGLPFWFKLKLALFAGIIGCGVAIRFALMRHFSTWSVMATNGPTDEGNAAIKATYVRATSILLILWLCIGGTAVLAIMKP